MKRNQAETDKEEKIFLARTFENDTPEDHLKTYKDILTLSATKDGLK